MKLAHIWSSSVGAALSEPYLERFRSLGFEIHLLSPPGPEVASVVERLDLHWHEIRVARSRFVDPLADLRALLEIRRICRREAFDVVHTHNIKTGVLGRLGAWWGGVSCIVHTHHGMSFDHDTPAAKRIPQAVVEWLCSRVSQRVLVQSDADRRTVIELGLTPAARVTMIGNGVALDRFDPARVDGRAVRAEMGLAPEDVLFVSAGRLIREKGFVELGQASARLRESEPHTCVAIAGARDHGSSSALTARELEQLETRGVRLLGERADMPEVIAAADVFVFPSWREGMPRALMEAAAMGKALISSDARGCREVVVGGVGEQVPVKDPEALAGAMIRMTEDVRLRADAGARARERALADFDLDRVIEQTARIYGDLLAEREQEGK